MKLTLIAILFTLSASAQRDSTFRTRNGDIIKIKGTDTLIAFAGNWFLSNTTKKFTEAKQGIIHGSPKDLFWDEVAQRRLIKISETNQVHGHGHIIQ